MCVFVCARARIWWEEAGWGLRGGGGGGGERAFGVIWDREMNRAKREHTNFLEEVLLIRVIN